MVDEERSDEQTTVTESVNEPDAGSAEEEPLNGCEAPPTSGTLEAAIEQPPDVSEAAAQDQRVRLAEDRLAQVLEAFRELKLENEGFKDRTRRNIERRFEQRTERLLLKFIDVLDNFDRALESAEGVTTNTPLFEGLILVRTQLLQILQQEGLERIPVLGMPFDPYVAEAVGTEPVEDASYHHIVVREILRGYRFHDRLVRAVRVIIGECAEIASESREAPAEAEQPSPAPAAVSAEAPKPTPTHTFDALDDASSPAEMIAAEIEEKADHEQEAAADKESAPELAQHEGDESAVSGWVPVAPKAENREEADGAASGQEASAPAPEQSEAGEEPAAGWVTVAPASSKQASGEGESSDPEASAAAESDEGEDHGFDWVPATSPGIPQESGAASSNDQESSKAPTEEGEEHVSGWVAVPPSQES